MDAGGGVAEGWLCGGAAEGVGVKEAPWKMGQPVAGGTGCRGLLVTGG